MKMVEEAVIKAGELKKNPFRERLDHGVYKESDLREVQHSCETLGWWGGVVGRRLQDGSVQLGNGHRRIAAIIAWKGADQGLKVKLYDFTDRDMLLVLANSNPYRLSTEEERGDLIRVTSWFLTEYGESYTGQVDTDLLKASTDFTIRYEGAVRISKFLGPGWSQRRVSEILAQLSNAAVPEKQISTPISVEGILDKTSTKEPQSMTLAELNATLDEVEKGLAIPLTPEPKKISTKAPPKPRSDKDTIQMLIMNRKSVITKDLKDRVPAAMHRVYIDGLVRMLGEVGA